MPKKDNEPISEPFTQASELPRHVGIIMDGNGRWAKQRGLPRVAGHKAGVRHLHDIVKTSSELGIEVLTLFAFSSENWRRPAEEVGYLMELFASLLRREVDKLHDNNVRLQVIGDLSRFSPGLQQQIIRSQAQTRENTGLTLVIAANYGGRWDITQAVKQIAQQVAGGQLMPEDIDEQTLSGVLCLADLPEPDLFIRTSGEQRISNFLIWQLAYTELYFTETLWPDFTVDIYRKALAAYGLRQRRYGKTGEQMVTVDDA